MDDIDPAFNPARQLDCATVKTPISRVVGPLTQFTTPVVYLYLDRLSNAFARWGRSSNPNHAHLDAHGPVKQAAQ